MKVYQGFILSREYQETGGRHHLHYAGVGDNGPFEIIVTDNRPLFFIRRTSVLPEKFVRCERWKVKLAAFDGGPVDVLYFQTQNELFKARQQLRESGVKTFESDIRPEERYLMERFIYGSVDIQGPCHSEKGRLQFINPRIRKGVYRPAFSVLSLDIETGQKGQLYSIACHFRGYPARKPGSGDCGVIDTGVVLLLDDGHSDPDDIRPSRNRGRATETGNRGFHVLPDPGCERLEDGGVLYRFSNEKELLRAFLKVMERLDPDILIGWHVVGFDLLFLERKYKACNVPFSIGRTNRPPKIWEVRKGVFRADIGGRIVIDGPPALRAAFYSFDNFRLETVASAMLGEGKEIGENTDKVAEIERRFRYDKPALAQYNLKDCKLVSGIFSKTGLIDLTFKRATLSGLPMDRVGMSVAAFEFYMLPQIHRKGCVAPNVLDVKTEGSAAGGWVFAKTPGFYRHVAVFDFKSLYPSIIRTFKIDPLSMLKNDENPLSTPVDIRFSRTQHVLPEYIFELMQQREKAKRADDYHLSQAIKILMNSFYGVMGTPGCRFYDYRLPSAITGTGQWLLKGTIDFLEQNGYHVLYGDTDSVFVWLKEEDLSAVDTATDRLVNQINAFIKRKIDDEFGLESHLEIEFERHFTRFFLPAIRGGGESAKKRYVGMIRTGDKDELVFTGLEYVRSDWTRFAKNFQYELFDRVFHDEEIAGWIKGIVSDLKKQLFDRDLVYKKRLRKPPGEYVKIVPPHVRAALLLEPRTEVLREIRYVMTRRGPVPVELPHEDLDYNHYIEKQLKPVADAVLMFFDQSFNEIMGGRQLNLF